MRKIVTVLLCFVFLLAACSAQNEPEVAEPAVAAPVVAESEVAEPTAVDAMAEPTAVPTPLPPTLVPVTEVVETAVVEPTVAAAETAVSSADIVNVVAGRTDEGAFFLGNPNAPLTVIDYSDFL